ALGQIARPAPLEFRELGREHVGQSPPHAVRLLLLRRLVERTPSRDRQCVLAAKRKIRAGEMQLRKSRTERSAMSGARPPDAHAAEKRDDGGRPAGELAEHAALAILHRLRAIEPARGEMLHQSEKERQIVARDPLLIEREDEIAAAGVQQEVRVLDALGNALVGQKLAEVVASEE